MRRHDCLKPLALSGGHTDSLRWRQQVRELRGRNFSIRVQRVNDVELSKTNLETVANKSH